MNNCKWCIDPDADADFNDPLCDFHAAEWEGLSLTEFYRREVEQSAEIRDARS